MYYLVSCTIVLPTFIMNINNFIRVHRSILPQDANNNENFEEKIRGELIVVFVLFIVNSCLLLFQLQWFRQGKNTVGVNLRRKPANGSKGSEIQKLVNL